MSCFERLIQWAVLPRLVLNIVQENNRNFPNQTNHPNPLRPESFSAAFHNRLLRCCIPAS